MLSTLLLAMALTGQTTNYDLIAQTDPVAKSRLGPAPTEAELAPGLAAELADARAAIRESTQALAESRAQIRRLTQQVVRLEAPAKEAPRTAASYQTTPAVYRSAQATAGNGCYSESYQSAPATVYRSAPATAGTSCYSESYQSAPSTYQATTPMVIRQAAPPVTYMSAVPTVYEAAPIFASSPAVLGSNVTTYHEQTRQGLFGRLRTRARSTSVSSGVPSTFATMPMTFGAGAVCTTCP